MPLINFGSDDNPDWRESNPPAAAVDTSGGPVWTRYTPASGGSGEDAAFDPNAGSAAAQQGGSWSVPSGSIFYNSADSIANRQGGSWSGEGAPIAVGRINSQGNNGTLFKGQDGYYFDGKKLGIDDATAQAWVSGLKEADKQDAESSNFGRSFDKFGEIAVPLFIAGVATAGFASALAGTAAADVGAAGWVSAEGGAGYAGGMAADAAATGAAAAAGETAGTAASTVTPGGAAMDTAGFEGIGGSSKGLIDTAITGAGRSAAINGAVQLATTGKIDPSKLAFSAISGGFGGVLGDIVGEATGMPFAGQVAGAVTGAVVGNALADKTAAGSAAVGAGSTTGDAATGDAAKTIIPANLKFSNSGLIYSKAPRTTDWSTPRLNWSGNA